MDNLVIYPQNKEELETMKALLVSMKMRFEQRNDITPTDVISGVKKSLQEANEGKLTPYTGITDVFNFLNDDDVIYTIEDVKVPYPQKK